MWSTAKFVRHKKKTDHTLESEMRTFEIKNGMKSPLISLLSYLLPLKIELMCYLQ